MRAFLIFTGGVKEWIAGEVLKYDRSTKRMLLRLKCGVVVDRHFDLNYKHLRNNYRIATTEDEHA